MLIRILFVPITILTIWLSLSESNTATTAAALGFMAGVGFMLIIVRPND